MELNCGKTFCWAFICDSDIVYGGHVVGELNEENDAFDGLLC